MIVRKLPDAVHDQLREQAARHKRSLEAEVRSILVDAVAVPQSGGFGQRLHQRFQAVLGDDLVVARDPTASKPGMFE